MKNQPSNNPGQFPAWSKPYYGVMHLGASGDARWATVTDWGSFAEVIKWAKGCGLCNTAESTYDTVEQAKAAGEAWIATGADLQNGLWQPFEKIEQIGGFAP